MIEIIPAILANSPEEFERILRVIEPYSKRIHLDIADGLFVPTTTIKGYSELELASPDTKFEVHLMVKAPLAQLFDWDKESADKFIVHVESEEIEKVIGKLKEMNKTVGIALNPDTPNEAAEPYIGSVDFVQFMTVEPGLQGREFVASVTDKIIDFRKKYPEITISVDGSINPETAVKVIKAGVSVLVSGSFILKSGDIGKAIEELKKIGENK